MSFSCPHFDIDRDGCLRLKNDCIPGRLGCVLRDNSTFAHSPEQRVREKENEKKQRDSVFFRPKK